MVRELDRGRVLLQSGRALEAVQALEPLVAKEPRNYPVLAELGTALLAAGVLDRSIEIYRSAEALRPDYGLSSANLARALRAKAAALDGASPGAPGPRVGDPRASALRDEAAAAFEKALDLHARDSESYFRYAQLELERSRVAAARDVLARAERADAGDPEIYLLMGRIEASRGETARARSCFEKVLALDARSGAGHEALGRLDFAAGDARAAEAHYARALDLAPSAEIAKTLGAIRLYSLSDREGALVAFRRAAQLARDPSEAREIADAIRELQANP